MLARRSLWASLLSCIVACGGNVVVDPATRGAGGVPSITSNVASTATSSGVGASVGVGPIAASTTTDATSGSGMGGAITSGSCSSPSQISDCGTCPNQKTCFSCALTVDQPGVLPYAALVRCVACNSCFISCKGQVGFTTCMGPPIEDMKCDIGPPSDSACKACAACVESPTGSCAQPVDACKNDPQCIELAVSLDSTCGNLPM
jgi:hypothetical protein